MDTSEPVDEIHDNVEEQEEEVPDKEEVPTKCISSTQTFQINCGIKYIDFEGRTDGESIMKLTSQLKPRRMILVQGSQENITAMKNFCKDIVPSGNSLFSTLNFSKAKDGRGHVIGHLAWVDGVISLVEEDKPDIVNTSMEEESTEVETSKLKAKVPALVPLPPDEVAGHNTNFVNELKLTDFKQVLIKKGIPSEFQQGNLLCGQHLNVQLRRHDSGRVMIEGCLGTDYYLIRELLYQHYAIV